MISDEERLQDVANCTSAAVYGLLHHIHGITPDIMGGAEGQKIVQGCLGAALNYAMSNARGVDDEKLAMIFKREIDMLIPQLRFAITHAGNAEGQA